MMETIEKTARAAASRTAEPLREWVRTSPGYWDLLVLSSLQDARVLLEGGRYAACCLHCHAAVEKALKALLAAQGNLSQGDDTHALTRLANKAGIKEGLGSEQWSRLVLMNGLHQRTSYPDSSHTWKCLSDPEYATMIMESTTKLCGYIYKRKEALGQGGGLYGD